MTTAFSQTQHERRLDLPGLLHELLSAGMISAADRDRLLESNTHNIHPLVYVAEQGLANPASGRPLDMDAMLNWLAGETGQSVFSIDPLKVNMGAIAEVMSLAFAQRHKKVLALMMFDIDHFKKINDTYGHAAGDEALIQVARALDGERRESDLLARYGGEEFTVLLEHTTGAAALQLAERLRHAVEAIDLSFEDHAITLTLSTGVAAFPDLHIKTASELLLLADEALYEAKRRGRNRSLLNLGRNRYKTPRGKILAADEPASEPEVPTLFA